MSKYIPGADYPAGLDTKRALEMLLHSCERLQFEMGGTEVTKNCAGLLTSWDARHPTVFYLKRNMDWARKVLSRDE
jgi:hypothetical protein